MKLQVFVVLFSAALLFGCTNGGTNATPTPIPTATPAATATPVATAVPSATPEATPQDFGASPTPSSSGSELDWAGVSGCNAVGVSYTYRVTTDAGTMDMAFAQDDGGIQSGSESVLQTVTIESQGMEIVTRQWSAKSDCACLKVETELAGQVMPGECPDSTVGSAASGAQTTVTDAGIEAVSVPAYTGLATKHHITTSVAGTTYDAEYWTATGIAVPVKSTVANVTMELVSYTG